MNLSNLWDILEHSKKKDFSKKFNKNNEYALLFNMKI